MSPFITISNNPVGVYVYFPFSSGLCKLEVLVPKGTLLLSGDATRIYFNYKLELMSEHILLMSMDQQSINEIKILVGIFDLIIKRRQGCYGNKE